MVLYQPSIGVKYSSLIAKLPVRLCDGWVDVNSFWCLIKRGGIPYQVIDIVISSCTINVITWSLSVRLYPKLLHRAPHITSPYRLLGLLHVHWTAAFYVTDFISFHMFGMQVWLPWLFSTSYIIKQYLWSSVVRCMHAANVFGQIREMPYFTKVWRTISVIGRPSLAW